MVFDGFPNTIAEVRHLSYVGMVPNITIDLEANSQEILACLSNDFKTRTMPKFSDRYVEHLLAEWDKDSDSFRSWFDREYQQLAKIPISITQWAVWTKAQAYITRTVFEVQYYFIHAADDWPLQLGYMKVTPLEFLERQSAFKTYCPCCLHYSNTLTSGGEPPDRTGLVQCRYFFYWICNEHLNNFLKTPTIFLIPYNNSRLPQDLPKTVHLKTMPKDNLAEDGGCVVCYKVKGVFAQGNLQYVVEYSCMTYLFDTQDCLTNFLKQPSKFICEIKFRPPGNYPPLNYEELPVLGMLEQYVAKYITKAVSIVARCRPVVPGLSVHASAVVGVGLYLKNHNNNIPQGVKQLYEEAEELFQTRRNKLLTYLKKMKSVINPYLHYDEPLPEFEIPLSEISRSTESIGTVTTKIVDDILDNIDYSI